MSSQIECIAMAFYQAEGDGEAWEREPEILKEEFRRYAREAVDWLQHQGGCDVGAQTVEQIEVAAAA